jgi:hypothetical protein
MPTFLAPVGTYGGKEAPAVRNRGRPHPREAGRV